MTHEPIGKRSIETDSAKWARHVDQADARSPTLVDPAAAEAERERATEDAIARIIGAEEASKLVASTPPADEPKLSAYDESVLRRQRAARGRSR